MSYLSDLKKFSTLDNTGGLVEINVARARDILSIPLSRNGLITESITFKEGRGFYTWFVTPKSASFKSSSKDSQEGYFKDNSLPFTIAKGNEELDAMFRKAEKDLFIIIYRDSNNKKKLFGTIEAPLRFKYNYDTGKNLSSFNSYDGEFFSDSPDNTFYYSPEVTAAPAGVLPVLFKKGDGTVILSASPGDIIVIESGFTFGLRIIN